MRRDRTSLVRAVTVPVWGAPHDVHHVMSKAAARPKRTTYTAVFRSGEFRALWLAELLSIAGDQIARVALSVLVFNETRSPGITGLAYALTYLPALIGGGLLASLADRYPRRRVMVICDLASAAFVGVMAIPGMPIWVVCVALVGVTLSGSVFRAARLALLPEVLSGEEFVLGMAIRSITQQSAQVVGFAGGGVLIAAINPNAGLALNMLSFVASGLLVFLGTTYRPAAADANQRPTLLRSVREGSRLIWRDPMLRSCVLFAWLYGFYVVPEALAAPFSAEIGGDASAVGLLLAAIPVGSVIGDFCFTRFVPDRTRSRLVPVLAAATGLPLVAFALMPNLYVALVFLVLSGMLSCYHVQAISVFGRTVPADGRAQASGLSSSGLMTSQGLGVFFGGLLAEWMGPSWSIAVFGGIGAVLAGLIGITWRRAVREQVEEPTTT